MTYVLDAALRPFATEAQWGKLCALQQHGSERAAARALGCTHQAVHAAKMAVLARATKQGYAPDHDMKHSIPDGYMLKGMSTLYDAQTGEPKIQWVKTQEDKARQHEMFMEIVDELTNGIPRANPVPWPSASTVTSNNFLATYPVGDHHLGMLAWGEETMDADYDIGIGERLLQTATNYLANTAAQAEHGLIVFLGDFMHYDSFIAETPTSRNALDADSRFPKMVRAAIRSMRYMVERALTVHRDVHVIVEIGNHDLSSSIFLMECLANVYENEPRVTIDTSPSHYHYHRFGKNLLGVHHGHGTKMQNLPMIMATDRPQDWGDTIHRLWMTGHIHTSKTQAAMSAQDFSGCRVESFNILAPTDAWAAQKGYRSTRNMQMIMFHAEHGEVCRNTVNPAMLGE